MICNQEIATKVGQNLFQNYQKDGNLDLDSLQQMLKDCYQKFELPIPEFSEEDLIEFAKILDIDQDTQISQDDVQKHSIKLLVNEEENQENKNSVIEYEPILIKCQIFQSDLIKAQELNKETIFDSKLKQQESSVESVIISQLSNQNSKQQITNVQPLAQTNVSNSRFVYPLQNEKIRYEQYNSRTQKRLQVAERLFQQFQHDNYITENEAGGLLQETYKQLNMPYKVTNDDVKSWMLMADKDRDGKVYLKHFQDVLLDSLVQAGININ